MVEDSPQTEGAGTHTAPFSQVEVFDKHFPYYLSIGMTPEQYWDGDSALVKYYREADDIRRHRENERLWLQGMYIYEAICDVTPILRMGSKENKPIPYSKEPYPLNDKEIEERREKEEKLRYEQMMASVRGWQGNVNDTLVGKEK